MYLLDDFLDMAMENRKEEWKSETHRRLAMELCLENSNVTTMDSLMFSVGLINKLTEEEIGEAFQARNTLRRLQLLW